jgi:imidazole glycerol-phosphate synthase subunit HisF
MAIPRVIPVLLLHKGGLVKSVKFKNYKYIGDPVNAVKIFNEKEVDELCLLDIDASKENREPSYKLIEEIASECFMPLTYGGGVCSIDQIKNLIRSGVEKIVLSTITGKDIGFISKAADRFGNSTLVGCMDVKTNLLGKHRVYSHSTQTNISIDPTTYAKNLEQAGVGELMINSVDRDGSMQGYDYSFISAIVKNVTIPVIACGGCGSLQDIDTVINKCKASAAAAGSFFLFKGPHKAILITYPEPHVLQSIFSGAAKR